MCCLCRFEKPEVIYAQIISNLKVEYISNVKQQDLKGNLKNMLVEMLMNILLREEETAEMRQLLRSCYITQEEKALSLYSQL